MDSILTLVFLVVLIWLVLRVQGMDRRLRELETRLTVAEGFAMSRSRRPEGEPKPTPAGPPAPTPIPPVGRDAMAPEVTAARVEPPRPGEKVPVPATAAATAGTAFPPPSGSAPGTPRVPLPETMTPPRRAVPVVDWEQFMGVKLFAWIGGLALFLGLAFFVKYSFEHDLIPPELRVALGFIAGLGLLIGGVFTSRRRYAVTAETLCATGVVTLYAVTFACRSVYRFELFGPVPTFLLMVLITATAFLLAVRLEARVVAILGMLGGFLTPALLSTGEDNPLGLFSYVALLDAGLVAVALHRRWSFLVGLGALGTVLTQLAWAARFFTVPKLSVALAIFLGFSAFFLGAHVWAERRGQAGRVTAWAAAGLPVVALAFATYLLPFPAVAARPGALLALVFGADLCLLALTWTRRELAPLHVAAGSGVFVWLTAWTLQRVSADTLPWALAAYLVFTVLHSAFPIVLARARAWAGPPWWAHLFPPLALILVIVLLVTAPVDSLLVWPVVLLVDLAAMGLALVTASTLAIVTALVLTIVAVASWMLHVPPTVTALPAMLLVIGGFAALFLLGGTLTARWILASSASVARGAGAPGRLRSSAGADPADTAAQVPMLSALLPFVLLIMVIVRLGLPDPSPVFGLALILAVLILGLARFLGLDWMPAVGLAGVLALEHAWHVEQFQEDGAPVALAWYLGFFAVFAAFPFLGRTAFAHRIVPWAVAALSGPLHFFLVYEVVRMAFPNPYMGLLPLAFALPPLLSLAALIRMVPADRPQRTAQLAWFGGAALFFVTLVFPIQFERQWITIGWALEGAALLWLFHRVPHPGLRLVGVGLLGTAFVRLALNPAVLSYDPGSATPILNWYLYAYGVVSVCLFAGARLLASPRLLIRGYAVGPLLDALATVLVFILVNVEIADYFGALRHGVFRFTGSLAQDMTYSIAWGLFALGLLLIGMVRTIPAARYASLGLLSVTLLKLFLHDLARLGQLYRIGAFIGVAVIAILASFLYQRFLSGPVRRDGDATGARPAA